MLFEQLNPHACRTYLIGSEKDNSAIIVDPVIDHFQDYLKILKDKNLKLTHVIDTHTHADHISAGSALKDATDCEYIMHENAPPKCVTIRVKDGDILEINGYRVEVIHTPGHTRDSISLIIEDIFLTGDFLFLDDAGAGRDDLPGGNPEEHWESLEKMKELSDQLMIYPAHEYRNRQPSSLGKQRQTNPHLKPRGKDDFVKYLDDLRLGPAEWMKDVLKANYACAKDPNSAWIPIDTPACEIKGTLEKGVNETEVGYITAVELKKKFSSSEGKPILLDVREPYELSDQLGAIEGVVNVPIGFLTMKLKELEAYKNEEIIVICRSGARATTGAQILKKASFNNVTVLEGGMIAWKMNK